MPLDRGISRLRHRPGLALVELVGVITALAMLVAVGASVSERARELARRRHCATNLKQIGTTCKIYSNDHQERWPIPAFRSRVVDDDPYIDYRNDDGTVDEPNDDPGEVGYLRSEESRSRSAIDPDGGSTAVSTTRAFWILVRSGDLRAERFVCPSSGDTLDPTESVESYYDFRGYANISYGYVVPFGPRIVRPEDTADPRKIFGADKGPFYLPSSGETLFENPDHTPIQVEHPPLSWQPFNSPNHGGLGFGEGQNCLFVDGHVSFERRPTVGVDNDNIYTVMSSAWADVPFNLIHGELVHGFFAQPPVPGQEVFGAGVYSSTDSFIYP